MKNKTLTARTASFIIALLFIFAVSVTGVSAQITPQAVNERIAALAPLIAAAPNDEKLYTERANLYFVVGKLDDALADANKAVQLSPVSSGALLIRATVKARKKDYDGAIADYTEVIRLFPTRSSRAYFWRGETHELKGEYDLALLDYDKAAELDPTALEAAARARVRVGYKQTEARKSSDKNQSKIPAVWQDGDFATPDSEYIVGKIVSHDGKSYPGIVVMGKLLDESEIAMNVSTAKSQFKENYWKTGSGNRIIVKTGTRGFKLYEAIVVEASERNLKTAQISNDFKSDLTQIMYFKDHKLAFDRSLILVRKDGAHPSLKVEVVDILDSSNLSVLRRQPFPITNEKKGYADLLDGELKAGNLDEAKAVYQHLASLAAKSGETDETKAERKTNLTKLYREYDLKSFVEQEMTKYNYTEAEKQAVKSGTITK